MGKRPRPSARETVDNLILDSSSDDDLLPDETKRTANDRLINGTRPYASRRARHHSQGRMRSQPPRCAKGLLDLASATSSDHTCPPLSPTLQADKRASYERIAWSDEESDQESFRRLKDKSSAAGRRKTTTTPSAKKRKPNKSADPGVVGKKPRKEAKKTTQRTSEYRDQSDSDSDDDRIERELPDYIKNRKTTLQENRNALDNAGLRVPPSFEDVEFTDDERLDKLEERPVFPDLQPCAPYADRQLRHSLGVIPAAIAQWLREYQVEGAEFLHDSFVYQKGALLGEYSVSESCWQQ